MIQLCVLAECQNYAGVKLVISSQIGPKSNRPQNESHIGPIKNKNKKRINKKKLCININ